MQFVLGLIAYGSAAAAGVKILASVTHVLATSAAQNIQLPETNLHATPTLVERRLIAQAAPVPAKPLNRRIVALDAPEMPVALMANALDEAETAYDPSRDLPIVAPVKPEARHATKTQNGKNGRDARVLAKVSFATHSANKRGISKSRNSKQPFNSKKIQFARKTNPNRFATFETPGHLMSKALLSRQS